MACDKKSENNLREDKIGINRQIACAICVCLTAVSKGAERGFTSELTYSFKHGYQEMEVSDLDISWMGAALSLGSIIGFFVGGWLAQYFGKRVMLVLCNASSCFIWIMLACNKVTVEFIIIERFSMGIFSATAGGCIGSYISETSQTKLRRVLGTFQASGSMLGYLLANIMGALFVDWRNSALVLAMIPLFGSLTMLLFPETPYWLAYIGRLQDSRKSMEFYRGAVSQGLDDEFNDIIETATKTKSKEGYICGSLRQLTTPSFIKPFCCIGILYWCYNIGGYGVVRAYSNDYFENAGAQAVSYESDSVILGTVMWILTFTAPILLLKLPKKCLFVFCGCVSSVGFIGVGLCNQMKYSLYGGQFDTAMNWFTLIIAILPAACVPLGIQTVLNLLLGELFPTDIRSISVGIVKAVAYVAGYANMMIYPMVSGANAFCELMYVYGAIAAFMTVWAMITVKETDNMSLVEIEKLFKRGQGSFRKIKNSLRRPKVHNHPRNETSERKDLDTKSQEITELAPLLKN